ncbi:TspO/MBR family protein [Pseudoblastomonas halimionae]|uniref:Tryptophan-rich sensory protein n=1 Tax=Alteriqipengyuania halimionae TaxID=1926630 RepID=A0A6I4U6E2_9SPHN|nr:TspO/MBR family protein [Alteriqipengyuania halimionae]MXP10022.1 tryptophan-rich sensory protein [Alteriqipengyuania halimionae]
MNLIASPGQLRASLLRWSLFLVPLTLLLGFLSGQIGDAASPWFQSLTKPSLFPPPATFGIVWSILYVMIGFAAAVVASARGAHGREVALIAWVVQLALNLAWSPLFFGAHRIAEALYLLIAIDIAVLVTVVLFWRVRKLAGLLLVPYLAWVLFATVLNFQFLQANPDAANRDVSGAVQRVEM